MNILYAGKFGEAVAKIIECNNNASIMSLLEDEQVLEQFVQNAKKVAVVSWRAYPAVYEKIDTWCWQYEVPWTIAEFENSQLNLGPLVVPGASACYSCYAKRVDCHHEAPERKQAIRAALSHAPGKGVPGFIRPLVMIAAAHIKQDLSNLTARAGQFKTVDVLTSSVLESEVIGIHDCNRCRPKPETYAPQNRYFAELQKVAKGALR